MARLRLLFAVVLGVFVATPASVRACGPSFLHPVFFFDLHPDIPFTQFAAGRIGVVQPTWARSYLVVTYRHFSGNALSSEEQQAARALWRRRLAPYGFGDTMVDPLADAESRWREARKIVPSLSELGYIDAFREVSGSEIWQSFLNCPRDAFETAARTLSARSARFGPGSEAVKSWVAAQDQVFANCSGANARAIPATLPVGAEPLARADRSYQIAAAHFYAGDWDDAGEKFRAIAADTSSPWRALARYLAARALIRKATLSAGPGEVNDAPLREADALVEQILADPAMAEIHPAARRLAAFIAARKDPRGRERMLAAALVANTGGDALEQNLDDYTKLLDRTLESEDGPPPSPPDASADPMTRWIWAVQARSDDATAFAVAQWRKTPDVPWLTAAMMKVDPGDSAATELVRAAAAVPVDHPASTTLVLHHARILKARGETDAARSALDALLAPDRSKSTPLGAVNLALAARLPLARTLPDFIRDLPRTPVAYSFDLTGEQTPDDIEGDWTTSPNRTARSPRFDETGVAVLNQRLPTATLLSVVRSSLEEELRRDVALAGWVRSVLLKDDASALAFANAAASLAPQLAPALRAYRDASAADRPYEATITILRTPALRPVAGTLLERGTDPAEIDTYRDNWWCALAEDGASSSPWPLFLTNDERATAKAQAEALAKTPTAPNWLAAQAIAFAQTRKSDPRVPEALHLAVRATRYGCTDEQTSEWSKRAFQMLHRQYPGDPWTLRTKYHF